MNAWWLSLPLVLSMGYIGVAKKEVARRMADMTGYNGRERFFTVSASLAPYPFMIATVWIPFTTYKPALFLGLAIYVTAAVLFFATLRVFGATSGDRRLSAGPFRITRNPLYVAATLMFLAVTIVTMNLLLLVWLVAMCIPQHFMILAEERVCREKYGTEFEGYMVEVPRYLFF
jgi:protein-S-isoprenylcysteine O-methyltransferase Ste14